MSWADERRADKAAAADIRIREQDAAARRRRDDRAADAKIRRVEREQRDSRLKKIYTAATGWLSEHRVRLTIGLLAVASAVMAIPAMAKYGNDVAGNGTGIVLPVLSELGAWAFTFAVHDARRKGDPVWALLVGVWLFALGGAAMNVLHGIHRGWDAAIVMGFAAIAGIVAHQLAVASPRRTPEERSAAQLNQTALRKAQQVRHAAIKRATAEIDPAGRVTLVFPQGRFAVGRRGVLRPVIDPDAHVGDELGNEVERFLTGASIYPDPIAEPALRSESAPPDSETATGAIDAGSIATLDSRGDQRKSKPSRVPIEAPKTRSIEELREQLKAALIDPAIQVDPTSANSIRLALRIAPKTARQLRNEYRNGEIN